MLLNAPDGFLTEVFPIHEANARKSVALPPVSIPFHHHQSSSSLQQLTDKTDLTDQGQMTYQVRNPSLQPNRLGVATGSTGQIDQA